MAAGLANVKRAMGPGAVILHTRTYRRGGFLGIGGRNVVEITAADGAAVGGAKAGLRPGRSPGQGSGGAGSSGTNPRTARPASTVSGSSALSASASAGDLIRRTYAVAKAEMAKAQNAVPATGAAPAAAVRAPAPAAGAPAQTSRPTAKLGASVPRSAAPAITPSVAVVPPPPSDQLTVEMQAVKRMVARLVRQQHQRAAENSTATAGIGASRGAGNGGSSDLPDKLFDQYLTLLKQEVTEELAEEIVQQVRSALQPGEMDNAAAIRRAVLEAISKLIPADDSAGKLEAPRDRRPRTIALVGPTGVGKTTTIAKLAANFKLKYHKNVGLITLDTYRIAAVDQLRTYAHIIGLPLHVAASAEELTAALRQCAGCDVVLIDTRRAQPA